MNLVWIDLEMTGLDPDKDKILEIAVIITDKDLNVIDEGFDLVIHEEKVEELMTDVVKELHSTNNLVEQVKNSKTTLEEAEEKALALVKKHCLEGETLLCGNTIWCDRRFIIKHMPKLNSFFHYRMIDVSTIKELAVRWYPNLAPFMKKESHRALDDIKESIEELKYFRKTIFR